MAAISASPTQESGGRRLFGHVSPGRIAAWIVIALLLFVTIFPFLWVLRTALTSPDSVYTNTGSLVPVDGR